MNRFKELDTSEDRPRSEITLNCNNCSNSEGDLSCLRKGIQRKSLDFQLKTIEATVNNQESSADPDDSLRTENPPIKSPRGVG